MKRLAKLAVTEAVRAENALHISFDVPPKLPFSLIRLNHADVGYRAAAPHEADDHLPGEPSSASSNVTILADVGFGLEAGDHVALLGPNGAGKSTLIKTLIGELPLLAGECNVHGDIRIGYFAQHTVESLRAGATPMDHLCDIAPEASTQDMRSFLGRWYFSGQRAFQSVDVFSGGEQARLALALIAWRKPNVLLSHDRHLIGLVCETFWRVADDRVKSFKGDLDEYAVWLSARANKSVEPSPEPATATAADKPRPKPRSDQRPDPPVHRRQQQLAKVGEKLAALASELADPGVYAGKPGDLDRLVSRYAAVREAHEVLETD